MALDEVALVLLDWLRERGEVSTEPETTTTGPEAWRVLVGLGLVNVEGLLPDGFTVLGPHAPAPAPRFTIAVRFTGSDVVDRWRQASDAGIDDPVYDDAGRKVADSVEGLLRVQLSRLTAGARFDERFNAHRPAASRTIEVTVEAVSRQLAAGMVVPIEGEGIFYGDRRFEPGEGFDVDEVVDIAGVGQYSPDGFAFTTAFLQDVRRYTPPIGPINPPPPPEILGPPGNPPFLGRPPPEIPPGNPPYVPPELQEPGPEPVVEAESSGPQSLWSRLTSLFRRD